MTIKSIRDIKDLAGKTVFLRADLNVPIKSNKVKEDYKIVQTLPTIRFLLRNKCRLIIATHLSDEKATAKPAANRLARLLDKKVLFINGGLNDKTVKQIKNAKTKEIIFLDNLRFNPGEEKNDRVFGKTLAGLADIYVNDAFAVSHRNHASVSAIKNYLPGYAGLLLEKEIINLNKVLKPKRPLVSIVGGSKIETKIALLNNLAKKSYRVLIGGALANNFIAAKGFEIGRSLSDKKSINLAAALMKKYKNLILPLDVLAAKKMDSDNFMVKPAAGVGPDEIILDIGPRTVKLFADYIKKANTLIWNGPLGYFESPHFKFGTLSVARLVAARSTGKAFGAVGGGETIEALKMTKMENYVDWVSTGGGAMLAYLGGEPMPGLK